MDIVVTPFDAADDVAIERGYEILADARAAEAPDLPRYCRQRFVGGFRHPMPGEEQRHALAHLDDVPVGYLTVTLPQLENLENAQLTLAVHPGYGRRGVGRALYGYAVRLLRDLGRKRVVAETVSTLADPATGTAADPASGATPGDAFALAMGGHFALADVRRRLDVAAVDSPALDRLLDAARLRAAGYSVVRWPDRTPEEYVDDVAYLDSRLVGDAPLGDLTWDSPVPDVARLRGIEAGLEARGMRWYNCGVRHDATGRLVAWTMIGLAASCDWHAYQQITLVEPRHRGHRLGTIIKIENLRYALEREPALRFIDTYNAASNTYMISINEAMGFRPVAALHSWQATI
ncbi:GNAT family N-acetyltransferase [Plantactinospora sp. CA-290183]|uniref:GNAT family N-acetyltransferase n=1 Tax=Plantactinospora sp. CA-290183 TaxID=3240006 RepID=UPI003D91C8EE